MTTDQANTYLLPFTAPEGRKALATPFTRPDGNIYACDGRICIRMPAWPDHPYQQGTLDPEKIIPDYTDYPPVHIPPSLTLEELNRSETCPDCCGTGEDDCPHCGHTAECDRCHGKCTILAHRYIPLRIDNTSCYVIIPTPWFIPIFNLPGLQFRAHPIRLQGIHAFTFDHGDGAFMSSRDLSDDAETALVKTWWSPCPA